MVIDGGYLLIPSSGNWTPFDLADDVATVPLGRDGRAGGAPLEAKPSWLRGTSATSFRSLEKHLRPSLSFDPTVGLLRVLPRAGVHGIRDSGGAHGNRCRSEYHFLAAGVVVAHVASR